MLESNQLLIFVTVVLLYAFMPGPAMLYSVAQTVSSGKKNWVTVCVRSACWRILSCHSCRIWSRDGF